MCKDFKPMFLNIFFSIILAPSLLQAAPKLQKEVENIANTNLFRLESIELLYDKQIDFEKIFNCRAIGSRDNGNSIHAICMPHNSEVAIALLIGKSNTGYPNFVLACPGSFDSLDPFDIIKLAYDSGPVNFLDSAGISYYMGKTNGWVKKFENSYITVDLGFSKTICWALHKR